MGSVHRSFLRILERKAGGLAADEGLRFEIAACADRSGFFRGPDASGSRLTREAVLEVKESGGSLGDLPGAEAVALDEAVELAGRDGILMDAASMDMETGGIGLTAARAALARGTSAVFANKSAVALAFDELESLAAANGARMGWSATVCGGLPVINAARREMVAARFLRVRGVFNATSNLVLDEVAAGRTVGDAIREAQERGIAETDPTNDLNGTDTAAKLAIFARTVLRQSVTFRDVPRAGIEAAPAPGAGEVVRLLGEAVLQPEGDYRLRVAPRAVPRRSFFGAIGSLDMAVEWETDLYQVHRLAATEGDAGPTAAAMLRDAVHIVGAPYGAPDSRSAGLRQFSGPVLPVGAGPGTEKSTRPVPPRRSAGLRQFSRPVLPASSPGGGGAGRGPAPRDTHEE